VLDDGAFFARGFGVGGLFLLNLLLGLKSGGQIISDRLCRSDERGFVGVIGAFRLASHERREQQGGSENKFKEIFHLRVPF
jgi:hypothetical protein